MNQLISRRRFMHATALGTATAMLGTRLLAADSTEKPLFRFMQWNDTHVEWPHRDKNYRLANKKLAYLVEWVNNAPEHVRPDFVVGVGDLINGGSPQISTTDFEQFAKLTAPLKVPLYPVIGNHENSQQEGDPAHEAAYCKHFGKDSTNYTFEHGGVLFVMLNDSGTPMSNNTEVGQRRREWIRDVLKRSPDQPKFICCHIPLIPVREESVLKKSFGFESYLANDAKMLEIIEAHSDSVIAVLSGHLHLTGVVRHEGVYQIVASGSASYPSDSALYEVFPDRVHVRMISLPEHLLENPFTNIHGKRRHGIDYTDALHKSLETYLRGNPEEREFNIVLEGKKRLA